MLRQLTILTVDNKKKKIAIHPSQIVFIEELTPNKCNIVVRLQDREFVYLCPKSYNYLYQFTNLTTFNLFMEN